LGAPKIFAAAGADWVSQRGQGGARRAEDTSSGTQAAPAACPQRSPEPDHLQANSTWMTRQT